MNNDQKALQFFDNFLFPKIFQSFRMSIQPSKLIIAFLALTVICLAGWIMDVSTKSVIVSPDKQMNRQGKTELQVYLSATEQIESHIKKYKKKGEREGVFSTLWSFASTKFHGVLKSLLAFDILGIAGNIAEFFKAVGWAIKYHYLYCIVFFIIKLTVISVAGGAICRISALQFARDEKPGVVESLRYSTKKFMSFFAAPLVPLGIIVFAGLFITVLGLVGNLPWAGELVVGISMPMVLAGGALIAVVLIGAIAGFSLMFPAVAYDGSDCFDAISRSFSYVYAKPWKMGFYTTITAVYGAACYLFVRLFAFLLLWASRCFLQIGVLVKSSSEETDKLSAIWPEPHFMNFVNSSLVTRDWSESIAAFFVYLFLLAVVGLVASFMFSFYFSANTIIYSLMRSRVDNTATDEIYVFADETAEPIEDTSDAN